MSGATMAASEIRSVYANTRAGVGGSQSMIARGRLMCQNLLMVVALGLATNAAAQTARYPLPLCKGEVRQCPEEIAKDPQAFLKRSWANVWVYNDLGNIWHTYQGCDARELHKFLVDNKVYTYGIFGDTEPQKYSYGYKPSREDAHCQYVYQYYKLHIWRRTEWFGIYWPLDSVFSIHVDGNNAFAGTELESLRIHLWPYY